MDFRKFLQSSKPVNQSFRKPQEHYKILQQLNKLKSQSTQKSCLPILSTSPTKFQGNQTPKSKASAEDILPLLLTNLQELKTKKTKIREMAKQKTEQKLKQIKLKQANSFKMTLNHSAAELIFHTKRNDILPHQPRPVRPLQKKKNIEIEQIIIIEPDETETDFKKLFQGKEHLLTNYTRRFSMSSLKPDSMLLKKRMTLANINPTKKRFTSTIESSDDQSQDEQEIECLAFQRRVDRDIKRPFSPIPAIPDMINLRQFSRYQPDELKKQKTEDATKVGYLQKRRGETNKFHERWVVLRGFKLYWYRGAHSNFAKGMFVLPNQYVKSTGFGREETYSLPFKGKTFTFQKNKQALGWKNVLNNQICLKQYLESNTPLSADLLLFIQNINATSLEVKNYVITSRFTEHFVYSLEAHQRIQILHLENCMLQDHLIEKICNALRGIGSLVTINFSRNVLTKNSIFHISSLLKQEQASNNNIMNIHLSHNRIDDDGIKVLCIAISVRFEQLYWPKALNQLPVHALSLDNTELGDDGIYAICALFRKTLALVSDQDDVEPNMVLDLSYTHFSSEAFRSLAGYLGGFQGILELKMAGCNLQAEVLGSFIENLKMNYSMMTLDLRDVELNEEVVQQLVSSLKDNYVLTNVQLTVKDQKLKESLAKSSSKLHAIFTVEVDCHD